jgi:Zn-finger nucleic acid-binding protein
MKCPNDDVELEIKTFNKVRIDECKKCRGMWFDHDELKRAKDSEDEDLRWLDFDIFEQKANKYTKSKSHRFCPKEGSMLEKQIYSNSKIVIDFCSKCQGIWLDYNEFEKIVEYLENMVVTNTSEEYAKEALRQFTEILNGEELKSSEFRDLLTILKLGETRLSAEHEKITAVLTFFPIR